MKKITTLTDSALQKAVIVTDNSKELNLTLRFLPTQKIWIYNLTLDDFTVNGRKLVVSPNLLRQYVRLIDFGMLCTSESGFEPYRIDDFSKNRVSIFVLTEEEIKDFETSIFRLP